MGILEASILQHVCIVLILIWLLSSFNWSHPVVYFVSLIYLYLVHEVYVMRLRKKLRFEERIHSNQQRVLPDSETVRWLNHAVEKIWPVCMENIVSQKILLPIIPWFLDKYKPWTVKQAVLQHLYMGRSPPMFTEMRVLRQSTGDDHLVLELGMNFRTADDMSAVLAMKLTKRLGFGMRAKMHLMGLHVEGKILIGVKFIRHWPFLGRLRVCFVEPPYFQMTVKPIFTRGLDVTELPGIAGWLDKLLALAFEQTLVEPNMLVVDVEKLASPQLPENWFSVDEKLPIAYVLVEVIEGADMMPSDLNGLADPYVKGQLGPYRFRTKTQRKTLAPKWHEEFKVPICTWDSPKELAIEVRDKDHFIDDTLGDCSVNISDLRGGQRHDMWLSLRNIKTGQLHLAITVVEGNKKAPDHPCDNGTFNDDDNERNYTENESSRKGSFSSGGSERSTKVADKLEPIDIDGQKQSGIWVHRPGSKVSQTWEPRKGRSRVLDAKVCGNVGNSISPSASGSYNNSSTDGSQGKKGNFPKNKVLRGLKKIGSVFNKKSKNEDMSSRIEDPIPSPQPNLKAINAKQIHVKLIVEDNHLSARSLVDVPISEDKVSPEGYSGESPSKRHVKDMAKSILKHAGKSARGVKHAFNRKGSKNSQCDSGSVVTERDISVGSEFSDEESLASPVFTSEGVPVIPKVFSSCGNDFSEDLNDPKTLFDFRVNDNEKIVDGYPSTTSEENDDRQEELVVDKNVDLFTVENQNLDNGSSVI